MQTFGAEQSQTAVLPQGGTDRRSDLLLRDVVHRCQPDLERRGFRLDGRGSSGDQSWVRFRCPSRDARGHDGSLVLLVAHGRRDHALLVDAYFVDALLDTQTPQRRLLQRYEQEAELPRVVREVVDTVRSWPT